MEAINPAGEYVFGNAGEFNITTSPNDIVVTPFHGDWHLTGDLYYLPFR